MMAALIGLGISNMVLRWWVSQPGTAAPWRSVTQLLSLGLLLFFGRVLGPLWLVTTPLLTHAIFNSLSARPRPRTFALVSSCGLLLLAVGLEQLGVLTPSYSETSAGLLVRPNLANLPLGLTLVLMLGGNHFSIVTAAEHGPPVAPPARRGAPAGAPYVAAQPALVGRRAGAEDGPVIRYGSYRFGRSLF